MKTEIKIVMVPQEKAFWVADDGTTFEKKRDCADYEQELFRKQIDNSKDIIECKEVRDRPPFDGGEYLESHYYRWFKPLNEDGIDLLNKAFPSSYGEIGNGNIGNWLCVEYADYDDDAWWYRLSNSQWYASEMLRFLEHELYDRSGCVTEVCPHCEMEVEMKWDVKVHGYRAFCPYCGKRLMLCDECLHPEGEFNDACDYCTKTDNCKHNRGECDGKRNF